MVAACRLIWQIGESSWLIWPDKDQMENPVDQYDQIKIRRRTRDQIGQRERIGPVLMGRQTKFPKQKILLKVKRPNRERVLCPPKWRNATSPVTAILLYFWCKCKPRARHSLWRGLCSLVQFLFTNFWWCSHNLLQPVHFGARPVGGSGEHSWEEQRAPVRVWQCAAVVAAH